MALSALNDVPRFTGIVIPSLNQGRFLAQALESVFSQREISVKVAVCDGGSTDLTLTVAGQYMHRFAFFRSHPDRGQAAAINEGISQLTNTLYVGWLNADDVLLPDGLRAMASYLDHHPECVAVFGKAHIIDEEGRIIGQYPTRPFNRKTFAIRCTISQPASLIRESAWVQVGGLDESIETCMDYDLWWRLSKIGQLGYIDRFVACSRDHPNSKTRTLRKLVNDEAVSILLRHRGMVPRNWCMQNIIEGLENYPGSTSLGRRWKGIKRYVLINKWKALLPQNWRV